jgi:hypothetical protein
MSSRLNKDVLSLFENGQLGVSVNIPNRPLTSRTKFWMVLPPLPIPRSMAAAPRANPPSKRPCMLNTMASKYPNRMYVGNEIGKQCAEGRKTRCVSGSSALTYHASRTRVHQARVRPSCRGMAITLMTILMRQLVCTVSGGRVTGWR